MLEPVDVGRCGAGWEPLKAMNPSTIAVSHADLPPLYFVPVAPGFNAANVHVRAKILALQLVVILTAAAMATPPRGRYALEATGGSEPSWSAATAIDLAQEVVVGEFRQSRNLMRDSDFAFAFGSYEEAQAVGGQFVATAWARIRADEMDHLIPEVAETLEASSSSAAPPRLRPAPQLRRAQGGLRLQPKKDTPENVLRRVDALQRVFLQMGAFKPTGELSEVLQRDWKQSVRRLAQDRVTQAETTTVLNAIRTWQEMLVFLRSRNRSSPPGYVEFDTFLREGTLAPSRALQSLKWLSNQGKTKWELAGLQVPKQSSERKKAKSQATVIEPPMVPFLEEKVQAMYESGNALWTAALGSWIVGTGVLRYQHVVRSYPLRLSRSTVHAHCPKGKQSKLRRGFDWAIPSHFSNGFNWGEKWLDAFLRLSPKARASCGFCFNGRGAPWSIAEVQRTTQELFRNQVEPLESLTTYSFRRLGPTIGLMLKLPESEMLAMGDWTEKGSGRAEMPQHYAGSRYTLSMRVKHQLQAVAAFVHEYDSWELVPPEELAAAAEHATLEVTKAVSADSQNIWSLPPDATRLKQRFSLAAELMQRAQKKRGAVAKAAPLPVAVEEQRRDRDLPPTLGKFVLTQFLKSGTRLCTDFNLGECHTEPCPHAHLCAVLLQSGRACGGKHAAKGCWGKRAMKPSTMAGRAPAEPSAAASASTKEERPPSAPAVDRPAEGASSSASKRPAPSDPAPPAPRPAKKAKPASKPGAKAPVQAAPLMPPVSKARAKPSPVPAAELPAVADVPQLEIPEVTPAGDLPNREFDRLATCHGKTAEAPSLIYQNAMGGQLFLAGMPTEATQARFPRCDLQVVCFPETLQNRGGVRLRGAQVLYMSIASNDRRDREWNEAWPRVKNSLWHGDSVVIHCLAGKHRAATFGAMLVALLQRSSLDAAMRTIKTRRYVEIDKALRDRNLSNWVHRTLGATTLGNPFPKCTGYLMTERSHVHIQTMPNVPLCAHKQSSTRAERLRNPTTTSSKLEAIGWSKPFCQLCTERAPASFLP